MWSLRNICPRGFCSSAHLLTDSAKAKAPKAPVKKLRRLRIQKIRQKKTAVETKATRNRSTSKKGADNGSATEKEKHQFTSAVEANALSILQIPRTGPAVPTLCHDLSRVLFNPGIYQLQDPRSRVFNFDPYLEKIMPVSEFDFKVLKEYITSSRDEHLRSLALEQGKKYVGSSSSMTSTLSQFHFLLSQWRDITTAMLSRGFTDTLKSFTTIQRIASSVFLRYKDGVYAMDADKEYDSANILMSLGRSMEKLLTQNPQDYERYRKTSEVKIPEEERGAPEAYQYTYAGDFLMRAQLDAYDSRLPGTGTFDLKTRAVASIRHNLQQHEEGFGYEIKTRFGDWESYEREYFDMMRSAFLKYSLQVRLGQMDGIFVAFHNVERIFGFQYISLPEMDLALHGQHDTTLGDQEFKVSVELLNRILNRVTEKFPGQSLRLLFETRDSPGAEIYMQIFAEVMDEACINAIQTSKKEAIDAFQQRLMNPELHPQSGYLDSLEAMYEQHKSGANIDSLSPSSAQPQELKAPALEASASPMQEQQQSGANIDSLSPSSAEPQEPKDPALEASASPMQEQSADNGVPAASAESEPDDKHIEQQLRHDKAASDTETIGMEKSPAINKPKTELLALTLRIRNKVNGVPVGRPENLTSSDAWTVEYSLEEIGESKAWTQYRASKARRKTALEARPENSAANYYLRMLRELATRGAEWRKAQDELDAGRKRVVLYGN